MIRTLELQMSTFPSCTRKPLIHNVLIRIFAYLDIGKCGVKNLWYQNREKGEEKK